MPDGRSTGVECGLFSGYRRSGTRGIFSALPLAAQSARCRRQPRAGLLSDFGMAGAVVIAVNARSSCRSFASASHSPAVQAEAPESQVPGERTSRSAAGRRQVRPVHLFRRFNSDRAASAASDILAVKPVHGGGDAGRVGVLRRDHELGVGKLPLTTMAATRDGACGLVRPWSAGWRVKR